MSLKDDILSSIEAEIEVLKAAPVEAAPAPVEAPVVEAAPAPAPVATEKHSNPIIQLAIDQAAQRLARETA
jgi:hypothetical protein